MESPSQMQTGSTIDPDMELAMLLQLSERWRKLMFFNEMSSKINVFQRNFVQNWPKFKKNVLGQTADAATTAHAIRNGLIPYYEDPQQFDFQQQQPQEQQRPTNDFSQYPQQPCGDTDESCYSEAQPIGPNLQVGAGTLPVIFGPGLFNDGQTQGFVPQYGPQPPPPPPQPAPQSQSPPAEGLASVHQIFTMFSQNTGVGVLGEAPQQQQQQPQPNQTEDPFDNFSAEQLSMMTDAVGVVKVPVAQGLLIQMKTRTVSLGEQVDCRICMCECCVGETIRTLPCCHEFHAECIDKWFELKPRCPLCVSDVRDSLSID